MDHRTPCSLIFIPDWDADVVPVSMCCCSGIPHEVCNEGTPEEVAPQMSSDEEIVVPRKRPLNQRTIPIWRPSSSHQTADVSSQSEPEQSDQQGTSKTIQEITDEYVASQAAIPTAKTKDVSRMERSTVQSFDRRVMIGSRSGHIFGRSTLLEEPKEGSCTAQTMQSGIGENFQRRSEQRPRANLLQTSWYFWVSGGVGRAFGHQTHVSHKADV